MKTYIRTYPVTETKNHYIVKGVTLKQMSGTIDRMMKKVRWGVVEPKPIAYSIYEEVSSWGESRELGEFIYE